MKLVSKVTEIYCIADDFCKEYHSELNKTSLSLSNPSANNPKHRKRKGRMSDAEMITILILFHSNTFRNFKHFYLILLLSGKSFTGKKIRLKPSCRIPASFVTLLVAKKR